MRAEIVKREKDFATGIQKYSESAKRAQQMDNFFQPYQQYFSMNGGAPNALAGVLKTATTLQYGTPVQKAQTAAKLIKDFGVDISALDSLLVGETPPAGVQQSSELEAMLEQKLAPYKNFMGEIQTHRQNQQNNVSAQAKSEVTKFSEDPANEFYNEVKADMADLLDMAAQRGQPMTMKQAYDKACVINTEVSTILSSRKQKETLSRKKNASSSITGSPGGSGAGLDIEDRRGMIAAAFEGNKRL
jgi:hypothetical protein